MIPYYTLQTVNIGPLIFNAWGLFAGLAFALALFVALKEAKRKNIKEDHIFDLAILILVGGVAGARAAYVLENWNYFSQNQAEILSFKEGGLMFLGGALGVALLVGAYLKFINPRMIRLGREKISLARIADSLTPSFAIGEFIGRIGCVLACSHLGVQTSLPWAQEYLDGSTRHPIAIYMSLNGLAMFLVFWFLRKKIKIEGALFMLFVLWYSGTRFFLDFLRCGDLQLCDPRYSGYTPSQYISGGVFIFALIFLIDKYKKHMAEKQNDSEANKQGKANENKDLQSSAVSHAEAEEVIFESKDSGDEGGGGSKSGAGWRDKFSAVFKKPWAMAAVFVAVLTAGAAGASVYYNSMYYGEMFKKSPFSFQGKTWISSDEPIVGLKIVNDKNCVKCDVTDVVKDIKGGIMPTLSAQEIDFSSAEGKKLIETFKIKFLPALIFESSIEKAAIFEKAKSALENKDNLYYLSSAASGIPPGKFLELPKISAEDRSSGSESAPVTIIEFSDFMCPYCKQENDIVKQVLAAYPDKARLVFKHLPLPIHPEAQFAAEAAECAGDQGKFFEMADTLFANQDKLDAASITKYARDLKLDGKKFKECTDSGKFKDKIANDSQIAAEFGIGGTPAFFVGDEFLGGAASFEQFKEIIDAKLAK
ncbi:prolipoprotein diacylglyceryl transferase [Patescibacteria group bacterium]|nr:prolipoprotein diacylglyceryl transferase [Patescibacteria group bacterium]